MNRWKRTSLVGALLLLLLTLLPTTQPAFAGALGQGRLPMKYFWPTFIPQGMLVQPTGSFASETLYMLKLEQPGGGQFSVTISGGAAGEAPGRNGQAVTIRGQQGTAFTTGAGYTVIWTEQGQVYAVTGGLGLQDTLAIGNGLEVVDLAAWQRRLAGVATRPSIYYNSWGTSVEIRPDGSKISKGRIADLGPVIDAIDFGLRTLVLSERGLQIVGPQEAASAVIARFTKGGARFGQLIGTPDNSRVIYQYVRKGADSPSGFSSVVGIVDGQTLKARKVYGAQGQVAALGLSGDGKSVYVIDRQDYTFPEIRVISVSNGKVLRSIPAAGYGPTVQSPDRRTLATTQCCVKDFSIDAASILKLYDLSAPAAKPQLIDMTRIKAGAFIRSLIWSSDSRYIYIKVGMADQFQGPAELWLLNVATSRLERVAGGLPAEGGLATIDVAGRWLLHRDRSTLDVVDLTTGATTRVAVPIEAVLFRWR